MAVTVLYVCVVFAYCNFLMYFVYSCVIFQLNVLFRSLDLFIFSNNSLHSYCMQRVHILLQSRTQCDFRRDKSTGYKSEYFKNIRARQNSEPNKSDSVSAWKFKRSLLLLFYLIVSQMYCCISTNTKTLLNA